MRVKEAVTDIVSTRWNQTRALNVVDDESFAVGSDALQDFSVKTPILLCAVVPVLILEGQVVVEEVVARDELSTVPLRNISALSQSSRSNSYESEIDVDVLVTYTVGVMKCAITVELAFVEVSFIYHTVGESELSHALRPALLSRSYKVTS